MLAVFAVPTFISSRASYSSDWLISHPAIRSSAVLLSQVCRDCPRAGASAFRGLAALMGSVSTAGGVWKTYVIHRSSQATLFRAAMPSTLWHDPISCFHFQMLSTTCMPRLYCAPASLVLGAF